VAEATIRAFMRRFAESLADTPLPVNESQRPMVMAVGPS
jgi:hypothetical protein